MSKVKNILEKLRPDHTNNKEAKTIERIEPIGHATDAVGWRPVPVTPLPYTTPERFSQFLENLDFDIESFISKAGPDRYNPRYYENMVKVEVDQALKELSAQREEHERLIRNIRNYQAASQKNIELHRQRYEEALSKIKEVQ